MRFPLTQGLSSCIKIFRSLEGLHIYHIEHLNTKTITKFYFLFVWQAGGLTYDICEVVSFLTKSDVGWDTICSKGGRFQIVGSVPTERGTGLTSKKEGTLKCLISIEVEGSDVPCRLRLREVDTVVGLALFLGGCSSVDKTKEAGWVTFFLKTGDFPFLSVLSVRLSPISELSNFACSDVNTGVGENSHLSSLRNACGECIGVAGGVLSLSPKGSSCISGDGIIGRKESLSFKILSYCSQCQILYYPVSYPCCIHFTDVNPSFRFLIKGIPDEPPCYIPWVRSLSRKDCCIL